QAVAPIITAFAKYEITALPEQSAILSLITLESGDLAYNHNHFPESGGLGQGKRNIQSPDSNEKYATELYPDEVAAARTKGPDAVLELVNTKDKYSFGSAMWFFTTQCDADIRTGLQAGTEAGFNDYTVKCIGTTMDEGRMEYWKAAKAAL
ncbi:hypothetical protein M501DRAFT_903923, partial [Patellaria atrata CBS 101060]